MERTSECDGVSDADVKPADAASSDGSFDEWAIVDVMGHQRYIGRVTEQTIAGKGFVRVDVPASETEPGFTKLIGTASIYAISPVSESIAREMCRQRTQRPIEAYELPRIGQGNMHTVDDAPEYSVDDYD